MDISNNLKTTSKNIVINDHNNYLEIWPDSGGIINIWKIRTSDGWRDIIIGYEDQIDFKENCEKKGFRSCKLSPYVCRIRDGKYIWNNKEYQIGKFGFDRHKIHGLMYDLKYDLKEININPVDNSAKVHLHQLYNGSKEGFPFEIDIDIHYRLEEGSELSIETIITNRSSINMPICDGWHPYFSLGENLNTCELKINSNELIELDKELIPTKKIKPFKRFQQPEKIGDYFFDNCFKVRTNDEASCEFSDPVSGITLHIYPDENYPYLQLFTPDDRKSIAIECLSAVPDAFNNEIGLIQLMPKENTSFKCKYVVNTKF